MENGKSAVWFAPYFMSWIFQNLFIISFQNLRNAYYRGSSDSADSISAVLGLVWIANRTILPKFLDLVRIYFATCWKSRKKLPEIGENLPQSGAENWKIDHFAMSATTLTWIFDTFWHLLSDED